MLYLVTGTMGSKEVRVHVYARDKANAQRHAETGSVDVTSVSESKDPREAPIAFAAACTRCQTRFLVWRRGASYPNCPECENYGFYRWRDPGTAALIGLLFGPVGLGFYLGERDFWRSAGLLAPGALPMIITLVVSGGEGSVALVFFLFFLCVFLGAILFATPIYAYRTVKRRNARLGFKVPWQWQRKVSVFLGEREDDKLSGMDLDP